QRRPGPGPLRISWGPERRGVRSCPLPPGRGPLVEGLGRLLKRLRPRLTERQLRLFACACLRQAWHLLPEGCQREAVEVSERFADGSASAAELDEVRRRCWLAFTSG